MQLGFASLIGLLIAGCRSTPSIDPSAASKVPARPTFSQAEPEVEFRVIPLECATAPEIAAVIEELLEGSPRCTVRARPLYQSESSQRIREFRVLADTRTNSLWVMAPPERIQEIQALIAALDVEALE